MASEPTVFVVDDDPAVRKGLMRLLEEVDLPAELFDTAQAFLNAFDASRRGCLVLDVRMPRMSGIDLQKALVAKGATLPIIIISAHGNVRMAVDAVQRGAFDFIEKPFEAQRLLDRVQQALALDAANRRAKADRDAIEKRFAVLTPKEREVIELAVNGMTNKEIASRLGVTPQAIDARRSNALSKLEVSSVPEAAQLLAKLSA